MKNVGEREMDRRMAGEIAFRTRRGMGKEEMEGWIEDGWKDGWKNNNKEGNSKGKIEMEG